jgi:hypothetical protein
MDSRDLGAGDGALVIGIATDLLPLMFAIFFINDTNWSFTEQMSD